MGLWYLALFLVERFLCFNLPGVWRDLSRVFLCPVQHQGVSLEQRQEFPMHLERCLSRIEPFTSYGLTGSTGVLWMILGIGLHRSSLMKERFDRPNKVPSFQMDAKAGRVDDCDVADQDFVDNQDSLAAHYKAVPWVLEVAM